MKNACPNKVPLFTPAKAHYDNDVLYRNHLCPEYDTCLLTAAVENMLLDCGLCPCRGLRQPLEQLDDLEVFGCRALLRAIFIVR
jgi:hypothetical protein